MLRIDRSVRRGFDGSSVEVVDGTLGVVQRQYLVMLLLWEDEPRGIKDVARALELYSGTLSPLLKRLEAAGLIRRDRRTSARWR